MIHWWKIKWEDDIIKYLLSYVKENYIVVMSLKGVLSKSRKPC